MANTMHISERIERQAKQIPASLAAGALSSSLTSSLKNIKSIRLIDFNMTHTLLSSIAMAKQGGIP